jgi:O-antigen/teichoic acid export membrane protein
VRYGLRANVATVALILAWRLDVFLVKGYRGLTELAMYAVAVGLCEIGLQVALSLRIALTPLQGAASGRDQLVETLSSVTRLSLVVGLVGAVAVALAAHPLVTVLYGARYEAATEAVRWLVPGIVALVVQGPLVDFLLTEGRVVAVSVITMSALVINIALNVALLRDHTFVAAALASTITYVLSCGLMLALFGRVAHVGWRIVLVPRRADLLRVVHRRPSNGMLL